MEEEQNIGTTAKGKKRVQDLLLQLIECTGQLADCEKDSGTRIAPVAKACQKRLLALQQILRAQTDPSGVAQPFGPVLTQNLTPLIDLKETLNSLIRQTEDCIAALSRQLECTERELSSLRTRRTAIRAYRSPDPRRQLR